MPAGFKLCTHSSALHKCSGLGVLRHTTVENESLASCTSIRHPLPDWSFYWRVSPLRCKYRRRSLLRYMFSGVYSTQRKPSDWSVRRVVKFPWLWSVFFISRSRGTTHQCAARNTQNFDRLLLANSDCYSLYWWWTFFIALRKYRKSWKV